MLAFVKAFSQISEKIIITDEHDTKQKTIKHVQWNVKTKTLQIIIK